MHSSSRTRALRVLTTRGLRALGICRLCGALIPREAREQHDRHHRSVGEG